MSDKVYSAAKASFSLPETSGMDAWDELTNQFKLYDDKKSFDRVENFDFTYFSAGFLDHVHITDPLNIHKGDIYHYKGTAGSHFYLEITAVNKPRSFSMLEGSQNPVHFPESGEMQTDIFVEEHFGETLVEITRYFKGDIVSPSPSLKSIISGIFGGGKKSKPADLARLSLQYMLTRGHWDKGVTTQQGYTIVSLDPKTR